VICVVTTPVAEVDAADERDVFRRSVVTAYDEQLLMVATSSTDALVQQHLSTALVHQCPQVLVLSTLKPELVTV
jgi:hypothetical protein